MNFERFEKAFEEFKQKLPEIADKLDNPLWQAENKEKIKNLKKYFGVTLIEAPLDEESLILRKEMYSKSFCAKDGMLKKSSWDDKNNALSIYINGFDFWNPEAVQEQTELLKQRKTLENILEKDPEFTTKVQTVLDNGWRQFLEGKGFKLDFYSDFFKEHFDKCLQNKTKTLMHPILVKKINKAYEIIKERDESIKSKKQNFAQTFPDFEDAMQELTRMQYKELLDCNGWWFQKDIEAVKPAELLFQYQNNDKVIDIETARNAVELKNKLYHINFKRYSELEKEHPGLKEKIDYIQHNKEKLLPSDYKGINLNTILNLPKKRRWLKGRGRFARTILRESRKEYDERIIETVNNLYFILQHKKNENPEERPYHQQERIKKWQEKGRKKEKISDFVLYVLEKAVNQNWYNDFQKLVNGFRFTGDYRINTSKHWSRQNIGYYVSAGQVKGEWGWNTLVSGSEERFDTPGIVLRQLREHKEEKQYAPAAKKFEELVNECILEYFSPEKA